MLDNKSETLRAEEERRHRRLIIRYTGEQREVLRVDEGQQQDRDLTDRLRRKR